MSELSERIRRNMTPNLDGWIKRLMTEAADEIDRLHERATRDVCPDCGINRRRAESAADF